MFGKAMGYILILLPAATACSVCIEYLQLRWQIGFCQLDDVADNSVGCLIGFLIFLMLRDIFLFTVMLLRFILKRAGRLVFLEKVR